MIGPKKAATPAVPSALGGEEKHKNDDGRGQDVRREIGVDLLQSLERGENGNGRRDNRVS